MGKVGETLGTFDKVLSVLGRLGLWGPTAASAIVGAALAAWSFMVSLPTPVIALCGLFGAAGGLWLYNGLNDLGKSRIDAPDYEAWDHVSYLTLGQAAALWAECEPTGGITKEAYPYFRMLKETADIGLLRLRDEDGDINQDSLALRSDLRELPAAKTTRPKFLFPDAR